MKQIFYTRKRVLGEKRYISPMESWKSNLKGYSLTMPLVSYHNENKLSLI